MSVHLFYLTSKALVYPLNRRGLFIVIAESHLQDANLTDCLGKGFTSNMHGFTRDLHRKVYTLLCAYNPLSIECL